MSQREVSGLMASDLAALEERARSRLDERVHTYIGGGAGDSPDANIRAWERLRLRPRMLRDVHAVSTETMLLGMPSRLPILVAPTAMHALACTDGELATSQAAGSVGVTYVVSATATRAIEEIAAAAPDVPRWMQAYLMRDRGLTRQMLQRAASVGCTAVVLTVDAPGMPYIPPSQTRPLNSGLPLPNLMPNVDSPDVLAVASDYAADLTFDELAEIRGWTGLPLVVKGVLRADDARRCLDAGADAVVVSNHGGRQLSGCIPTAVALEEVAAAVSGRAEVYVDGGIRSGADVLKALTLGARAVMVGRPVLWGLALDGSAGARGVLQTLRTQLERTMMLCGVTDVRDVPRDLIYHSID